MSMMTAIKRSTLAFMASGALLISPAVLGAAHASVGTGEDAETPSAVATEASVEEPSEETPETGDAPSEDPGTQETPAEDPWTDDESLQSGDQLPDGEIADTDTLIADEDDEDDEEDEEAPDLFARGQYSPKSLGAKTRLAGADRYETAVRISKHVTDQTRKSDVVFVATGATFPDALSIGALASYTGSPLLLVRKNEVPASVINEIETLSPSLIVIAGGTGAVSPAAERQLARIAEVKRIAGSDRYETSAAIATLFPKGSPAFVTTGQNFPDATVAAAPAGKLGGPVILTPMGTAHSAAAGALRELEPSSLYVIGGTWGASARNVLSSAAGRTPTVLSGSDRFATSAKVAKSFWGTNSATIIYARGDAFPDALTGVAISRAHNAPLLLTRQSCRPDSVKAVASTQAKVVILGGTGALSDAGTTTSCSDLVSFANGVYTFQHMTWEMQETKYYCGPAAGKMALKGMRRTTSADGRPLSQRLLAGPGYMRTDALGYTQGETNDLIRGMNAYLGANVYKAQRNPSGAQLRAAVLRSFTTTKRPILLGAGEVMGGYRYNGHPSYRTIGHYVVVYGFDTKTNQLLIMDSAAGLSSDYRTSARIFRYDVNAFADRFLRNFWHHGYYY